MPAFSVMQFDRLIEPESTTTPTKTTSFPPKLDRRNTTPLPLDNVHPLPPHRRCNSVTTTPQFNNKNNDNNVMAIPHMSPWLYTAPEQTPLPISPTPSYSLSSRFLINHKRRGPRLAKTFSDQNVIAEAEAEAEEELVAVDNTDIVEEEEEVNFGENGGITEVGDGKVSTESWELMRFWSSIDGWDESCANVAATPMAAGFSTPMADFYDAWEELSSDSGLQAAQRSITDAETELREMRLTLLMEIENRKLVEEALNSMQCLWKMLRDKLGAAGVVLPPDLANVGSTEDICRQIHLLRVVSESIGGGIAKAEVEAEMKAQLEAKNFEISRLGDRLRYYETVNREMCQINLEAVENARRGRQIRKRRQKWVWGSIVTAITLGSAALAWASLPSEKGSSSTKLPEPSEQ